MGIIYSKSESKKFIEDIQKNLKSGLEVTTDLTAGSHNIIQSIDGKTLSGAAYTAGKNLFSELIIPTVSRCHQSLQEVETDLSTYISANNAIQEASQETLDEEKLEAKIRESEMYRNTVSATASALSNQAFDLLAMTNPVTAVISLANHLFDVQGKLNRYVESLDQDIEKLKKDLRLLQNFQSQVQGLFNNSLNNFKIAMQSVLVLNNTKVNSDGTYTLPAGVDGSWFTQIKPNAKAEIDAYSSNAFLDLYKNVKELMDPLTSGKTDNMKRLDQLLALYPKALVDKLMKNDEFWMLADKLPPKYQTKLINGLAKYESFGQAVAQGKWIPKIDTIGKGYQWFNKMTNPIKTYVSESLKSSQFIQGAKNWGVAKGLGTAAQVATYAQLGVTFVSSGVDEYGKTGSVGKGIIGGAIDTVKSVGPLEGITIGAAVAGPPGAIVGGIVGGANKLAQFIWPNAYDNAKNWSYDAYDKASKVGKDVSKKVGKAVAQGVDTVKHVYKDVQHVGKSIGEALSSVKLPKISFGW